jgi:hypothetical protein
VGREAQSWRFPPACSCASREAFADHRETAHFKKLVLGEIVIRLGDRVIEMFDVPE